MKYLVLDSIRSAYNVGAIFRTAEGAGVQKIFLCGYTPTPLDRFGRIQAEIHKTSLGASEIVPWEMVDDVPTLIAKLKSDGVTIVALEQTEQSVSLRDFVPTDSVAYVLGNEVVGVAAEFLERADVIIDIPMLGQKESLNVSVAAGIVLYHDLT